MTDIALRGEQVRTADRDRARALAKMRFGDALFHKLTFSSAVLVLGLLGGVIASLIYGSLPAIQAFGLGFLASQSWNPVTDNFGALPAI